MIFSEKAAERIRNIQLKMQQSFEFVNPIPIANWNQMVLKKDGYSIFHSSNWALVLNDTYSYKPCYLINFDGDSFSTIVPVAEIRSAITGNRGVSLPFSDFCEPIIPEKSSSAEFIDLIIDKGKQSGWKYFEIRGGDSFFKPSNRLTSYFVHELQLEMNEKKIYENLRSSTKRNIRKANREGVRIELSCTQQAMRAFYQLNCVTRKRHRLPPQPYKFFENVHKNIISNGMGFVALAVYRKRVIAGAVFFHFGKKAMYKYGGSDPAFQKLRANNLLIWEAIRWYSSRDFLLFDLGRTEPGNTGLNQFKDGWGGRRRIVSYYKYDIEREKFLTRDNGIPEILKKFFHNLPLPLLRVIGNVAYKHIG